MQKLVQFSSRGPRGENGLFVFKMPSGRVVEKVSKVSIKSAKTAAVAVMLEDDSKKK